MDDQRGTRSVERGRALVGDETKVAHRCGQRDRRRLADIAAALEAIEHAGAEVVPGLVDPASSLEAHRRDVRAGGEAQVDVDQGQRAAEVEVERPTRRRVGRAAAGGLGLGATVSSRAESMATRWRSATSASAPVIAGASAGSAQIRRRKRPAASGSGTTGCVSAPPGDCRAMSWPVPAARHWRRSSLVSRR